MSTPTEEDSSIATKSEEDSDNLCVETKSEEQKKIDEEYLKYVKKAVRLYIVLKENDYNQDSPAFIKLWLELETGLEVAQILDSELYEKDFKEMFSKNDHNKIKVIWNLAEIKKFDVGDIFTDRNKKNGLVVGVFKFTVWILFE